MNKTLNTEPLQWTGTTLKVLDQRALPETIRFDEYECATGVYEAIRSMRVRGAPAIGIAAAYGVVLSAIQHQHQEDAASRIQQDIELLAASRPTAVNLFWALDQMKHTLKQSGQNLTEKLATTATQIHEADKQANIEMGNKGAEVIGKPVSVLTHCNAGALATGGYGTALGVIRSLHNRGQLKHVYADETRPWLQGARLTAWELAQDGIPATLIADSAAAWLMKNKKVDWVIVGADRITANGDVANKIGTYSLAVLAKQHGIGFMVAAPSSTLDPKTATGDDIEIEIRSSSELLPNVYATENSLVDAWNPVFDVTPAELISAIVTERGIALDPNVNGIKNLL